MKNKSIFRWFSFILSIPLLMLLVSSPTGAQIVSLCADDPEYPCREVTPSAYIEADNVLPLTGNDECLPVALPFQFSFYGVPYGTAYVSTNGFLTFLESTPDVYNYCVAFYNKGIPRETPPNGAIYAFWDDLHVDPIAYPDASVRTKELGTAPNRQFVIEWRNVKFSDYFQSGDYFDFEIVLHETGAILLQYRNISIDTDEMGDSATIGLENELGQAAAQYSLNSAAIKQPDFAILFGKAAKDVPVDITPRRCPNPVNLVNKGVLHVAILGSADLPVSDIEPSSVTLAGIAPLRWRLEDVGTPYEPFVGKTDIYHCNNSGRDGYPDLVFKFDTEDVVLGGLGTAVAAQAGQALLLKLDGKLKNGTDIKGEDSVVIIRGHHKWEQQRGDIRGHHKKEKKKYHHKKEKDKKDKD